MNYHKPYLFTVDDVSSVVKEYELHQLNLAEYLLKKQARSVRLDEISDITLAGCFYSGFLICSDETGKFTAVDLRVNEGMFFSALTRVELEQIIEHYLYGYALEEQKERDLKAIQLEREKKRNG